MKAAYVTYLDERPSVSFKFGDKFVWRADYLATEKGDDWYLAKTAGGFWVRRSIDGSEAQVFAIVKKVLAEFEPEVLEEG